jgi:hypothetical protein
VKAVRRFTVIDGQPKYLTVYDFERADVSESEAWNCVFGGPRIGLPPSEPRSTMRPVAVKSLSALS